MRLTHLRWLLILGLMVTIGNGVIPTSVRAQPATPVAAEPGSFAALLALAPDIMAASTPPESTIVSYADLEAQGAAIGVPRPHGIDDPEFVHWSYAMATLAMPQMFLSYALSADWPSLLGFDTVDLDQTLEVGEPPQIATLLRGRFDQTAIESAWATQGYRLLQVDGITVASLNEDGAFDLDSELGRFSFNRFNNAPLLPDGTLAYAPTLDGLREVIATALGTAPSLAERADIAALLQAPTKPLVSAMVMTGTTFTREAMFPEGLGLTPVAAGMPPIELALLGVSAGGPISRSFGEAPPSPALPRADFIIAALVADADAAAEFVRIAEERLATGESIRTQRPFTDFFKSWQGSVASDAPIAVLSLTFADESFAQYWLQMISARDLPYLAW